MEKKKPQFRLKKLLLTILAVVLVGAVGVGGYYCWLKYDIKSTKKIETTTPVVDETANWQTYTNAELGYSFKYSDNLWAHPIEGSMLASVVRVENLNKKVVQPVHGALPPEYRNPYFDILIYKGLSNLTKEYPSLNKFLLEDKRFLLNNKNTCKEKELNNLMWAECEIGTTPPSGTYLVYKYLFIEANGKIYQVSLDYGFENDNFNAISSDMYKILGTFEFIN